MLYDPKWEVQTRTDPFSLSAFADWLEKQPAEQPYDFWCNDCAIGGYFKSLGLPLKTLGCEFWADTAGKRHRLPLGFTAVSAQEPRTYGAAAQRARETAMRV